MKISESIFCGKLSIVPMADVQHIEYHWYQGDASRTDENIMGIRIITKHTRWDNESGDWANNLYMDIEEGRTFIKAWCQYRSEYENILSPVKP